MIVANDRRQRHRRLFVAGLSTLGIAGGLWGLVRDPDPVFRFSGPHPPRRQGIARPPGLALVLGGGGPRGFAHVGVLKALHRARIRPDFILGSSMGAVVGVLYAADPDAYSLETAALAFDPIAWWRDLTWRRHPWLRGDALAASLAERLQGRTLESLPIAAGAVATDQETGDAVALTQGDCVTAVRASAAIPGVFKPVEIEGRAYLDGDLAAPVPARLARALGAKHVVAVDVMCHPSEMVGELRGSPEWMISDYYRHALNLRDLPFADVVISPRLGLYASYSDEQRRRFIDIGEAAAEAGLPAIRRLLADMTTDSTAKKPT